MKWRVPYLSPIEILSIRLNILLFTFFLSFALPAQNVCRDAISGILQDQRETQLVFGSKTFAIHPESYLGKYPELRPFIERIHFEFPDFNQLYSRVKANLPRRSDPSVRDFVDFLLGERRRLVKAYDDLIEAINHHAGNDQVLVSVNIELRSIRQTLSALSDKDILKKKARLLARDRPAGLSSLDDFIPLASNETSVSSEVIGFFLGFGRYNQAMGTNTEVLTFFLSRNKVLGRGVKLDSIAHRQNSTMESLYRRMEELKSSYQRMSKDEILNAIEEYPTFFKGTKNYLNGNEGFDLGRLRYKALKDLSSREIDLVFMSDRGRVSWLEIKKTPLSARSRKMNDIIEQMENYKILRDLLGLTDEIDIYITNPFGQISPEFRQKFNDMGILVFDL